MYQRLEATRPLSIEGIYNLVEAFACAFLMPASFQLTFGMLATTLRTHTAGRVSVKVIPSFSFHLTQLLT